MRTPRAVARERWRGRDLLSYVDRPATVVAVLDAAVAAHGDREGVVDARDRHTYAEFAERVAGTAATLEVHGLGRGTVIGVVAGNSVDLAVLVFACAMAEVVMVGLSEREAPPRWSVMLQRTGADAIITTPDHAVAATAAAHRAGLDRRAVMDLTAITRARTAPWSSARLDEAATYAAVGTAGTTGVPKASRVVHRCSVHAALTYDDVLGLTPDDRTAVIFPLTYISAMHAHLLPMMLAGGTSVLTPVTRAHRFVDLLAAERISWMYTVPSFWLALLRTDRFTAAHLPALRLAAFGGGPFPPEALAQIRQRLPTVALHNVYGLSETHSPATILRDHEFADRPTSVGRPVRCMEARIVDDTGRTVPADHAGQLELRGSLVTTGYLGDAEATAAAFGSDGWFSTGDHARMDEAGYVWILGRRTDLIIRGGYNIAPIEVELALRDHPGIVDAVVYGVPAAHGADDAVACAVVRADASVGARDVRDWIRANIADHAVPRHVRFIEAVPLTPIGKVDRRALADVTRGTLTT